MEKVIELLANEQPLPQKYKDHPLSGDYSDCREWHITPDWLLIYRINNNELILSLTRTGTHSDLFKSAYTLRRLYPASINSGDAMAIL